jgi:hypothetical protein
MNENRRLVSMVFILAILASPVQATEPAEISEQVQSGTAPESAAEPGHWQKAGQEVKEAAIAVGTASKETGEEVWDKTREESKQLWDKTKEKSEEWMEKGHKEGAETWDKTKEGSHELWDKAKGSSEELVDRSKAAYEGFTAPRDTEPQPVVPGTAEAEETAQ